MFLNQVIKAIMIGGCDGHGGVLARFIDGDIYIYDPVTFRTLEM